MQGEAKLHIDAPAEQVFALVTDISRMGEWSPECVSAEWLDGATGPAVGARFRGRNRKGLARWSTKPEVTAVVPGREFAFKTSETVWRYRFEPAGQGTDVTESFETTHYGRLMRIMAPPAKREPELVAGMEKTLQRLKAAAEA